MRIFARNLTVDFVDIDASVFISAKNWYFFVGPLYGADKGWAIFCKFAPRGRGGGVAFFASWGCYLCQVSIAFRKLPGSAKKGRPNVRSSNCAKI